MKIIFNLLVILLLCNCQNNGNYERIELRDGSLELVKVIKVNDTVTLKYFSNNNLFQKIIVKSGLNGYNEEIVTYYSKNGDLDKYSIYINDNLKFYKFYNGKSSYGGNPLLYYNKNGENFDTLPSGSTMKLDLRIATPPHCISTIMYGDYVENDEKRDFNIDPVYELQVNEQGAAYMIEAFKTQGDFKRTLYWSIEDTILNDFYNGKNILNFHIE